MRAPRARWSALSGLTESCCDGASIVSGCASMTSLSARPARFFRGLFLSDRGIEPDIDDVIIELPVRGHGKREVFLDMQERNAALAVRDGHREPVELGQD